MAQQTFKRKKVFINKEMQGRYIFKIFVIFMLSAVVFTLFLGLITSNTQTMVYDNYQLKLGSTPLILWKKVIVSNWLFIVVGGVILVVVSVYLTHRIAGPIFRFEKCINNMMAGNLNDKIYLRGKDEAKELSLMFNDFNLQLSEQIAAMRDISNEMESKLAAGDNVDMDEIKELNAKLNQMLSGYILMEK
ncbi:methyl-accepting chemotaxis protein [bacterium]|nr:methyl-accepting chemotaxis protein [bacterium]